jgi:tRNA-splicing ligase RtcB
MISGRILKQHGWPEGRIIGLAKLAVDTLEGQGLSREDALAAIDRVRTGPDGFTADPVLGGLAAECLARRPRSLDPAIDDLLPAPLPYGVWGREHIDPEALTQMDVAMRLPVAASGALMPDAHVGYGLPIGGVLATVGAVIPYAIGVDIGCRMRLSVYPVEPDVLQQRPDVFKKALLERTRFGTGVAWHGKDRADHTVLEDPAWRETKLLQALRQKAEEQLGTSGSGNHFAEWGVFSLTQPDPRLGLEPGHYLALLTHSGSRAVGFKIAGTYSKLAEEMHPRLEKGARHLAWLPLDSEAGQEYWRAMELAGRFASANHLVIHRRLAAAVGLKEIAQVENFHNFAWREQVPDPDNPQAATREVIVHRKGATPAGPDVLGIIPGSMGDAGYVVRGLGEPRSLRSASHGAGRAMSRKAALQRVTKADRDRYLRARNVTLLGGSIDESPQAYKPIEAIIAAQGDLVDILGSFEPRLVRMAEEGGDTY